MRLTDTEHWGINIFTICNTIPAAHPSSLKSVWPFRTPRKNKWKFPLQKINEINTLGLWPQMCSKSGWPVGNGHIQAVQWYLNPTIWRGIQLGSPDPVAEMQQANSTTPAWYPTHLKNFHVIQCCTYCQELVLLYVYRPCFSLLHQHGAQTNWIPGWKGRISPLLSLCVGNNLH